MMSGICFWVYKAIHILYFYRYNEINFCILSKINMIAFVNKKHLLFISSTKFIIKYCHGKNHTTLEAFGVNNRGTRFIILFLADPLWFEGWVRGKDGASYPSSVLSFVFVDLYLHG